jgi:hypothetical protein
VAKKKREAEQFERAIEEEEDVNFDDMTFLFGGILSSEDEDDE